jgi:hypothetical protein
MANEEMNRVLRKLTALGSCFNVLIDSNQHTGISQDEVIIEIDNGTIFQHLAKFEDVVNWGLSNLSEEDTWRLLGEWQSMVNVIDSRRKLGISNNGICLLLAYVLEGIQMRTLSNEVWPGPEPW